MHHPSRLHLSQLAASILLILLTGSAAPAQTLLRPSTSPTTRPATQPAQKSTGLTHYMGRRIAQTMHFAGAPWLVRESRDRQEEPARLMAALKLRPGMTVCDLGCGNGFYSLKLADAVGPAGKVLAVDIQPQMLDMLRRRASAAGCSNIQTILGDVTDPKLPEAKIDLLLVVDTYHEMDHPVEMLMAMRKSLAPGGRMALVEFRAEDSNVPIKAEHRMSKNQIKKEITANGFSLVEEFDGLPWQHVMFFKRDAAAGTLER